MSLSKFPQMLLVAINMILAESDHFYWQNESRSIKFDGFVECTQLLSTVRTFSTGLSSGLWERHSKSLMLACFIRSTNRADQCLRSLSC